MCYIYLQTLQSSRTPLHEASKYGNDKIVEILIKEGADVNTVDKVSYSQAPSYVN